MRSDLQAMQVMQAMQMQMQESKPRTVQPPSARRVQVASD